MSANEMHSEIIVTTEAYTIVRVRSQADLEAISDLFYKYAASLGFDLSFQSFDAEMAAMPGKYAAPSGELLLARSEQGLPVGCVGLRPLSKDCCEMKRLYVLPTTQGTGIGRALALSILDIAERSGYQEMRLDTLPSMGAAVKMYRAFGFEEIPAYYVTPMEGTLFMSLKLPRAKK